jgi:hypothetical protein
VSIACADVYSDMPRKRSVYWVSLRLLDKGASSIIQYNIRGGLLGRCSRQRSVIGMIMPGVAAVMFGSECDPSRSVVYICVCVEGFEEKPAKHRACVSK